MNEKVRKLVTMAMLAALSIVLVYVIHFPIFPAASFLEDMGFYCVDNLPPMLIPGV